MIIDPKDFCISHTRAGSIEELNTPEIGGGFTPVNSVTYPPFKFGNGSECNTNSPRDYIKKDDNGAFLDKNNLIFNVWVTTNVNVTNGGLDGVPNNYTTPIFDWRSNGSSTDIVLIRFNSNGGSAPGIQIAHRANGVITSYYVTHANLTWLAGEKQNFTLVIARNGIDGGSDIVELWHKSDGEENHTLVYSSPTVPDEITTINNYTFNYLDALNGALVSSANAIIDNPKFFNKGSETYILRDLVTAVNNNADTEGFLEIVKGLVKSLVGSLIESITNVLS